MGSLYLKKIKYQISKLRAEKRLQESLRVFFGCHTPMEMALSLLKIFGTCSFRTGTKIRGGLAACQAIHQRTRQTALSHACSLWMPHITKTFGFLIQQILQR